MHYFAETKIVMPFAKIFISINILKLAKKLFKFYNYATKKKKKNRKSILRVLRDKITVMTRKIKARNERKSLQLNKLIRNRQHNV